MKPPGGRESSLDLRLRPPRWEGRGSRCPGPVRSVPLPKPQDTPTGGEGMAGPSGEQNCLYLLPFGTKSGSTLYRAGLPQRRPRGRGVGPQVGSDPWGPQ